MARLLWSFEKSMQMSLKGENNFLMQEGGNNFKFISENAP